MIEMARFSPKKSVALIFFLLVIYGLVLLLKHHVANLNSAESEEIDEALRRYAPRPVNGSDKMLRSKKLELRRKHAKVTITNRKRVNEARARHYDYSERVAVEPKVQEVQETPIVQKPVDPIHETFLKESNKTTNSDSQKSYDPMEYIYNPYNLSLSVLDNLLNLTKTPHSSWHSYNTSHLDNIYRYNYRGIEATFAQRNENITRVCNSVKFWDRARQNHLFFFPELGISWCPSYKAASTTWKEYFVARFVDPNIVRPNMAVIWNRILSVGQGFWPGGRRRFKDEPRDTIRYTLVRNPIVRIISFWKNAQSCGELIAHNIHKKIILRRHVEGSRADKTRYRDEFSQHWAYCKTVNNPPAANRPHSDPNNPYTNPPFTTFPELVDEMKRMRFQRSSEGHWATVTDWCDLCVSKMDYIAKLEKEPWELWFLAEKLGLWEDRRQFLSVKNSVGGVPSGESDIDKYMDLLTSAQKNFLNSYFSDDLKMFGYSDV